ncbi:tetraspanin-3-like [Rhineura floridana]|uniref:tetraspanin-3-like n=1 Tax=Rhineura floridana TaxID=261503 RepID=UPI002AC88939|nr:tetraspanin-3-like [Rhineura floridana]
MEAARYSPSFNPSLLCITESWSRAVAKVVLILLGFFLLGAAVAFFFSGAFMILTYKSYRVFFQNRFFLLPGWLAIMAALLLVPTSALAMCAPVRNSRPHQGTLMYLLLVLLCLEASSAIMTQIYSVKVGYQLENNMDHFFHRYNRTAPNHYSNEAVDTIHKQLKCCGIYNYTDWIVALPTHLQMGHFFAPKSCCEEAYLGCNGNISQLEMLFQEGCLKKLEERLHLVMQCVAWCCTVVGCLEMLVAVSNGILMREQPFQDFRILDSAAFS